MSYSNLVLEFPYLNELPKPAKHWLKQFYLADRFHSWKKLIALGIDIGVAQAYRADTSRRRDSFRRDIYNREEENLFSEDASKFPSLLNTGNAGHEEVIDLAREVATRSKYQGYGNATNLMYAKRVQLCIDSHYLNGRTGMVISARRDEWLIHFDNGMKGYFTASELSNIQEQAILLGDVA